MVLLTFSCQIALLDSPTALSMEEKLHQNEARVSPASRSGAGLLPVLPL